MGTVEISDAPSNMASQVRAYGVAPSYVRTVDEFLRASCQFATKNDKGVRKLSCMVRQFPWPFFSDS